MPQIHPNARTTPAVRAEIAGSEEPTGVLARRYGVSAETVRRRRECGLPRFALSGADGLGGKRPVCRGFHLAKAERGESVGKGYPRRRYPQRSRGHWSAQYRLPPDQAATRIVA